MLNRELHPDILRHYKQIEKILEKDHSAILLEFRKRIQSEEPKTVGRLVELAEEQD